MRTIEDMATEVCSTILREMVGPDELIDIRREAEPENSTLIRLEVMNGMIEMVKNIGFNLTETPKSITVVVEREDGTTVTESLSGEQVKKIVRENFDKQLEQATKTELNRF